MGKNKAVSTEVPENVAYEPEEDTSDMGGSLEELDELDEPKLSKEEKERLKVEKKAQDERAKNMKKAEEERVKIEEKHKKIDGVKEKENEVMKALIFDDYENLMSDCYTELDVNIQMVLDGIGYGCIVEGKGGTGKTYRILNQSMSALGGKEVVYIDSFTTPTALYVNLYENRNKSVIILDDCADMMNNAKILAMLKGALWHINDSKKRVVTYLTTKPPKDEYDDPLPRSFEIDARIIIITNYLKEDNPHVKAVLSRVNKVLVEVGRDELLRILRQVAKKEYGGLTEDERLEVLAFLEENTNNQTDDLNIRTYLRAMDYMIWAKKHNRGDAWKPLVLKMLKHDERLVIVEKLLDDPLFPTPEDKWKRFVELTKASRPTYYRLVKDIKRQRRDIENALGN